MYTKQQILNLFRIDSVLALIGDLIARQRNEVRYNRYRSTYDIHPSFKFNGPGTRFWGPGEIIAEEGSKIGRDSYIQSHSGQTVIIGEGSQLSHFVYIYTANRIADQDRSETSIITKGSVEIGKNCWLGVRVFVTEGSTIGNNTVVGANSVVTRDLPPHSICAGAPAKVQKFKSYLDVSQQRQLAKEYEEQLTESLRQNVMDLP